MDLRALAEPIVQAPLAGGASTPQLAAAVNAAGGLGFLAAGYRTPEAVREDIAALRALSDWAFGLNVFAPTAPARDSAAVDAYAAELRGESERYGAALGEARHDDDHFLGAVVDVRARGDARTHASHHP